MKRTKQNKKPDAILCGDFHLREDQPTCRTDDFQQAQWKKVSFVHHLQRQYDCPVIHSGDLFNHWKPSPFLLSQTIIHLPNNFQTIYGNHDLPQHNLDLAIKCGIYTLAEAGKLTILPYYHWGETPIRLSEARVKIGVWHVMTHVGKVPFESTPAERLLKKYDWFDLLLTGHNHQSFVVDWEGRLLVNPGSLTRQTADQIDHRPCVYLWYADTNTVEPVYLEIDKDVITREHIERAEKRDERIEAFVERLDTEFEAGVSFEENLEEFERKNKVRKSVMDIVYKAIE